MPAGDLIAANLADLAGELCYQVEFGAYLLGDADPWVVTDLSGFGGTSNDGPTERHAWTAATATGVHVGAPGGVVFTAKAECGSASAMEEEIAAVEAAWTISTGTRTPMELHMLIPHRGHVKVLGFPAQVEPTRLYAHGGVVSVVCTFTRTDTVTTHVGGGS